MAAGHAIQRVPANAPASGSGMNNNNFRLVTFDALQLFSAVSKLKARYIGGQLLQALVDELAVALHCSTVFIARASGHPPQRARLLACSGHAFPAEFALAGTPCELVYAGRSLSVTAGVQHDFPLAVGSGTESFHGFPFFDSDGRCIGHLALLFAQPSQLAPELFSELEAISLRLGAEVQRLDLLESLERSRQRLDLQNRVLRMAARQLPLHEVLDTLISGIEQQHPGILCSIMCPNPDGQSLRLLAGPSLPAHFFPALQNVRIGPGVGSCGTAAFTGQRVVARDLLTHPFWARSQKLIADTGLRSCWSQPVRTGDGQLLGVYAIYHRQPAEPSAQDIELIESCADLACLVLEYYQTTQRLALETCKYQMFLHTSPDGVVVLDPEGRFVEASDGFLRQIGLDSREALTATRIWDWDANRDEQACRSLLARLDGTPRLLHVRNRRVTGELWDAEVSAAAFEVAGQRLIWASARDITERRRLEEELRRRATTDELTGLANRATFMQQLTEEFVRSQRYGHPLSVLMMDVDHFKAINDLYGHQVGDEVLRGVADALRLSLRSCDRAGRIGGEEFAFILPETGEAGAQHVAERLRQAVAGVEVPDSAGQLLVVRCSLGYATADGSEHHSDELLRRADQALYAAKRSGRNRVAGPV